MVTTTHSKTLQLQYISALAARKQCLVSFWFHQKSRNPKSDAIFCAFNLGLGRWMSSILKFKYTREQLCRLRPPPPARPYLADYHILNQILIFRWATFDVSQSHFLHNWLLENPHQAKRLLEPQVLDSSDITQGFVCGFCFQQVRRTNKLHSCQTKQLPSVLQHPAACCAHFHPGHVESIFQTLKVQTHASWRCDAGVGLAGV